MTVAVGGEEAAAVFPEPRPDLFLIGLGDFQTRERFTREEMEAAFAVDGWKSFQLFLHFKQEHQPMILALKAVFADDTGEVQV